MDAAKLRPEVGGRSSRFYMGRACRGGKRVGRESERAVLDPWAGTAWWYRDLREAPASPSGLVAPSRFLEHRVLP